MKKITQKGQSLRQMYKGMDNMPPKLAFVKRLAKVACKSESTIRFYLSGQTPDALTQKVLSDELDTPIEVLFPKKESAPCDR